MDLSGQKIDKLKIIKIVVDTPYDKKSYLCKCDCGNTCTRLETTLKRKGNHSCGCTYITNLIPGDSVTCTKAGKNRKKSFVNGSNIQMTFREGTITTNTSGCQGVSYSKTNHKWHVYVGYQCYRANLGYYEDIKDAVKIRKLAEEAIQNNTFEDFYFKIRGHQLGEKSQKYFKVKEK